jgi:hypothetical protein
MKKLLTFRMIAVLTVLFITADLYAVRNRKDYFLKPQAGVWFGPVTPLYTTADLVETTLGGGVFFRYNLPFESFKLGLDSSYQSFESKGVNEFTFVPVCGNLIYLLPFNTPLKFQVKAGGGSGYVLIEPDSVSQWDPVFMSGFELSFPAGRIVNIGLRLDYYYIYEGHIEGATQSGHVFTSGISLYFNI